MSSAFSETNLDGFWGPAMGKRKRKRNPKRKRKHKRKRKRKSKGKGNGKDYSDRRSCMMGDRNA